MSNTNPDLNRPAPTQDAGAQWRLERTRNAQHLEDELRRRRERESARASALLAEFVATAPTVGLDPELLTTGTHSGNGRYKTNVLGWYLKSDKSLAVDTDGRFYILSVANSLLARFTGAQITPSDPPLILGAGGRDGESIDLTEAIDRLLYPHKY